MRFGDATVLDGVDLDIQPGEFVGLIGSNGAGKTTLLRALLGLQKPSGGAVTRADGLGRHPFGYVPQRVNVDADVPLRSRDVVALGLNGHRLGIGLPSAADRQRVDAALDAVGARAFADARVGTLSGGQQQRVLIAQALVGRPQVLLLDEPLANLDIGSAHDVVALLRRICTEQGIAVVLSAHDLNALVSALDRVVYLVDGRAVSGAPDEVLTESTLSALYRRPVAVTRVSGQVFITVVDAPGRAVDTSDAGQHSHAHGEER